jgi:hypothetical protein
MGFAQVANPGEELTVRPAAGACGGLAGEVDPVLVRRQPDRKLCKALGNGE